MNKLLWIAAGAVFLAMIYAGSREYFRAERYNGGMEITSPAFKDNSPIPKIYSCDGENKNPALRITAVPSGAKSLALIMDDPDAPRGTFLHWLVWNIPASTTLLTEGRGAPKGAVSGLNGAGKSGYTGPCPPPGKVHHYHFKLYALDAELNLSQNASKQELEKAISGHQLSGAELIGTYSR